LSLGNFYRSSDWYVKEQIFISFGDILVLLAGWKHG